MRSHQAPVRFSAQSLGRIQLAAMVVFLAVMAMACGKGGIEVTHIKSAYDKPSNVAVYFKVQRSNGDPVGGLTADQFVIYEDGQVVSQYESKQTIINPEAAASHYTLLLVDMSGSISESGNSETVVDAATAFTENVEKYQKVGVYAFDGSEDLYPIAPFTNSAGSATAGVKRLSTFKPRDPSTNLNGAIVKGLAELEKALSQAEHPMRFGTLVVFSDGTDHAARVSADDMRKAVKDSEYDVFAIGLGAEMSDEQLQEVGKNGTAKAQDRNSVVGAFNTIAKKIQDLTQSYYLLGYCSPARAGKHEVTIEAVVKDPDGKGERKGRLTTEFDAAGFGTGCDPTKPPRFDIHSGDAAAEGKDKKPAPAPKGGGSSGTKPAGGKASASGSADFNP